MISREGRRQGTTSSEFLDEKSGTIDEKNLNKAWLYFLKFLFIKLDRICVILRKREDWKNLIWRENLFFFSFFCQIKRKMILFFECHCKQDDSFLWYLQRDSEEIETFVCCMVLSSQTAFVYSWLISTSLKNWSWLNLSVPNHVNSCRSIFNFDRTIKLRY